MDNFKINECLSTSSINRESPSEIMSKGIKTALEAEQVELDEIFDPLYLKMKMREDNLYQPPNIKKACDEYWQKVKEKEKLEEVALNGSIDNPVNTSLLLSFINKRISKEYERLPRLKDRIEKQTAEYDKLMITVKQLEKSIRINKEHSQESKNNLEIFDKTIKEIESSAKSITIEEKTQQMLEANNPHPNSFTIEELDSLFKQDKQEITRHLKEMSKNSRKGWTIFFPNKEQLFFYSRFIESKEKYLSNLKELIKESPKIGACTDLYNAALYRQGKTEAQAGNMIGAYSYWKKMAFEFENVEKMEETVRKIEAEYFID